MVRVTAVSAQSGACSWFICPNKLSNHLAMSNKFRYFSQMTLTIVTIHNVLYNPGAFCALHVPSTLAVQPTQPASSTNSEITPAIVQLAHLVEHVTTPRWVNLGLALGVDDSALQFIEQDNKGDSRTGLRRMFQEWLSSCEQPSWDNVIRALRRIGENRLAAEICQKF